MSDLTEESITRLAELIRARKVSPVEVVEACLARIARLNPKLNAIVTIASDVMEQAKEAEAVLMRRDGTGPLHGVPVTIKDSIETAGLRSTSGSAMRAHFIPERDAPSVSRLKSAGAIILGKTNPAEMAMDYTADNPVFGRTNNPYDTTLTPGGSSGGEAAAISSGMSPCGLGSDLAGSIRIPSHFCGIAGLKPGGARVPGAGQFPPACGPYSLGAAIGPMARSVDDLSLLFNALVAPGISAPFADVEPNILEKRRALMRGFQIAWYTDDGVSPVTEETRHAVETAARALGDAGLILKEIRPPGIERGHDLWLKLFSRASVIHLRNVYAGNEEKGGEFVRWRLASADDTPAASLDDYIHSWFERDRLRASLIDWMNDCPLIVAPVGATAAYRHGTHKVMVGEHTLSTFRAFSYSQTFNVFDLPVVTIPAGRTQAGLPIGIQIVGQPFEEETILAAAAIVEYALGGWQAPPQLPD
ncbi:MAG: amidase [Pyrinomonadaceae bacterium]